MKNNASRMSLQDREAAARFRAGRMGRKSRTHLMQADEKDRMQADRERRERLAAQQGGPDGA